MESMPSAHLFAELLITSLIVLLSVSWCDGMDLTELVGLIEHALHVPPDLGRSWNTIRAYQSDWADFSRWCDQQGRSALPAEPETLCFYLASRAAAGTKPSTLRRRLAAIGRIHLAAGHLLPPTRHLSVRRVMAAIEERGPSPARRRALEADDLRLIVGRLPVETRAGARDRALLLLGFAGRLRRSELVGLDCEDLEEVESGLRVLIRSRPAGRLGRRIGIAFGPEPETCPVTAVQAWRRVAEIATGPLFRPVNRHDRVLPRRLSPQSAALVVKRALHHLGREAELHPAHSPRPGGALLEAALDAPPDVGQRPSF
jgi:integrase